MQNLETDILIVGTGLAGLSLAEISQRAKSKPTNYFTKQNFH